MTKTNLGLVAFAEQALKEQVGYCLGTFCQVLTKELLQEKCSQGGGVGKYNSRFKPYLQQRIGKRVSDCYGLVKGYVWTNDKNTIVYKGYQDRNETGAYNNAKVKGPLATLPEVPGIILWMRGHAGIYIGNGEFIECRGIPFGTVKGKIVNGKVVQGSKFTHWFKDTYIDYVDPKTLVKFIHKGKKFTVEGKLENGRNYVQARQLLEELGYVVGWDNITKEIIIK